MQILINVPDEIYEKIKTMRILISRKRSGRLFEYILFNSIKAGIPLPKGHGRLIDASNLLTVTDIREDGTESTYVPYDEIENAETIIKAESEK